MKAVRTISRRVLLGLGIVFLLISLLAGYAQAVVVSDSGFANTAAATLDHQDVRTSLSKLIVTKLIANAPPRLQSAEPFLDQAVGTVIGSEAFQNLFRRALQRTHTAILSEHNNQIVLNLSANAAVVLAVLSRLDPQLATKLQPAIARLKNISQSNALLPIIRWLHTAHVITLLAPLASLLCFLLAIALATNRRRELRNVGIAIAVPAALVWLLLVLVEFVGPWFVSGLFGDAFPGLVDAFLGNLRRWALVLAIAGIILGAIASVSARPLDLPALGARLRGWVTTESHGRFAVLGIGGAVVGLLLVFEPLAVFRLALLVAGAVAVYLGVYELIRLMTPLAARFSTSSGTLREGAVGAARWSAVGLVTVVVALFWLRNIWTV
jgi:hypothetical protein